ILRTREFDAKEASPYDDAGGNPTDDNDHQVLADHPDDTVYEELMTFLEALSEDELVELHAMVMLGRGDVDADGWADAVAVARDDLDENTPRLMLQNPLISDHLAEALAQFGGSCAD
ncbi:MAG: DUF3775 domain-containing protein, partial [Alphaproteobacteria bacterium]|nr:DUF3775 domain-containing protein [Alphaproteobacteria bacterium]